jgi:hypothetical protein
VEIVRPKPDEILEIQRQQGQYYFSGAVEVVLNKLGAPTDGKGPLIVTREAPTRGGEPERRALFEGPLSPSTAATLGVGTRGERARLLRLTNEAGEPLGRLVYNQTTVRRIPSTTQEPSEPYEFASDDPLWNLGDFEYQSLSAHGGTPILFATGEDGVTREVGLRIDGSVVLGVPVLDVLVQHHSSPPYDVGYYDTVVYSDLIELEGWLLKVLSELGSGERLPIWPPPSRAALTVRHDYDRPITAAEVDALLQFYAERAIRSTWFWRLSRSDHEQVEMVRDAGHEVALHSEAGSEADFLEEISRFETEFGFRPLGYSAHGGIPAPGHLGLRQYEWAERAGLLYGEMLTSRSLLPHQAVAIRAGTPCASHLVLPAQHRSLDRTTAPDGHNFETLLPQAQWSLGAGMQLVVMNHPDIHVDVLRRFLDELDLTGVWSPTLAEAVSWFTGSKLGGGRPDAGPR